MISKWDPTTSRWIEDWPDNGPPTPRMWLPEEPPKTKLLRTYDTELCTYTHEHTQVYSGETVGLKEFRQWEWVCSACGEFGTTPLSFTPNPMPSVFGEICAEKFGRLG